MFRFGNKNTKPAYGALFDVGSGTVGVAIAEFHPEKKIPHIVFSRRFKMRLAQNTNQKDEMLRHVRESILSSALILSQEGTKALSSYDKHAKISNVFVSCSSPWSYNISRTVEYKDDQTFKVSEVIIEDLVHSAEEAIFADIKDDDKTNTKDYQVVERTSVDISINDYTVVDPIDLKGSVISLSHIIGLIPNEILHSIKEVQEKLFPNTEIRTHTYMLIMYCIVRDLFPRLSNLSIVDVTGEAIEFGLVENGILIENNFLKYGRNTLVRDCVKITKRPTSDVITMLSDYIDEGVDTNLLNPVIEKYIDEYASGIDRAMSKKVVPNDVILTTERVFEPLFKYMLEKAYEKATGKKRTILTIDQKLIKDISSGAGDDVYLALEARFFHKLHGCGEIDSK